MFDIIRKWLTSKLGMNNCLNLNLNNIGERFRDGVLFARLLHKYKIIPDCYVHVFKKTHFYAICLNNMRTINIWLQFLDITIEDCVICEIACGQSLAVSNILYRLYFKFEMLKQYQHFDNTNITEDEQLNNIAKNHFQCNSLKNIPYQERRKQSDTILYLNYEIFNVPKIFCSLDGIQYTAIDVLKSAKSVNANKGKTLNFIRHNMNCFYDLFMHNLNNNFFKNEFIKNPNELCKSIMLNILNTNENIIETVNVIEQKFTNVNVIKKFSSKTETETEIHKNELTTTSETEIDKIIQNIYYTSQDDLKNENFADSLDVHEYKHFVSQNIFNEYLQHTGMWSSHYLNIDLHECNQNILSMIVKEVLSFEYGTSEIKSIEVKRASVSGVIDKIHNTKVLQLISDGLENNEILGFTADDALSACLNAYKEEMKISINKGKLYQVFDDGENQNVIEKPSNNLQIVDSDDIKMEVEDTIENDSTNSILTPVKNVSDISSESIIVTNEKLEIKNKMTQTPANIPEPDFNNPDLSPMAILGKLIDEKNVKNHDLQIGDVINCIGEFIRNNQGKNGWILLEFHIQPLQMALLEYKLTGKIPHFGKEICKHSKKMSLIVPEYEDSDNNTLTNTYLTHCIKIIKHRDEIHTEKWNDFFEFYKREDCIKVLLSYSNNIKKQPKKAADIIMGLILDDEYEQKPGKIYKLISINVEDNLDSAESKNDFKQNSKIIEMNKLSTTSLTTTDEKKNKVNANNITHKFQLLSTDLNWTKGNLTNYTYTALYLCDMWETMEHSYIHQIKELLNSKYNLFDELKSNFDLIINQINQTLLYNDTIMNLIKEYGNENLLTNNSTNIDNKIFELQTRLWDDVDDEFELITQFIKRTIGDQWIVTKNNMLINTYKELLENELKRTTITLNFLNRYYGDINENKINEFDIRADNIDNNDKFQMLCLDTIGKFEMYMYENYELTEKIDEEAWTISIQSEKYRFINQVNRIKASILLDKTNLDDLTKVDQTLEKIYTIYQHKINDINKLCELLKCAADTGKNIKGHIHQISGKFYINQLSVHEVFCKLIFHTNEHFNINQLKTITNQLLDYAPKFKLSINNFIDTLNKLSRTQHIYPKSWPTNDQFYDHIFRKILGNNVTTIDWRDFVVECMELPYPTIEQLLFYRKLFQANDIGDETITIEIFETTKLWFENESNQYDEAKWLLCDMYQFKNRINYSAMLLAFCKDKEPWMGLGKSFSLIFGLNPFKTNLLNINQSNQQEDGSENEIEEIKVDSFISYSSDVPNKEFIFDKHIMIWFLMTNLKFYIDHEKLGNIDISQIVQLIFEYIEIINVDPTVINLFRNVIIDNVYNTVFKFQAKELTEVAKNIVIEYDMIEI